MHKLAQFFVVGLWCCVIGGGLFGSLAMAQPPAINFKGHASFSNGVAFSPDGKRLATASADQTAKVWDAASGQESLTLKGHTGIVTSVAFSADGKRLASASYDKTVIVWDATSGRLTRTFNGHGLAVMGVAFSPDGKRLASAGSDRVLKVWDATSGQATLTLMGHGNSVTCVAFSPDGKTLATSSQDQTVKLWDATNGKEKLTLTGHSGGVSSVVFHPDGKRLLSASGGPQPAVKEWDFTSGQETGQLLGNVAVVRSVAISPDGKRFATATGHVQSLGDVKVWDIAVLTANPQLPQPMGHPPTTTLALITETNRPEFLTPERRQQNLLVAGTFETDAGSKWKLNSFRDNKLSGAIEGGVIKEGKQAAVLRTTITDDAHFDQTVPVKPGTRYLLSGWIKTKEVEIEKVDQTYGKAGATLSIWGGYEHSRSIVGTNDWQYVTLVFDARDRTEVTICARLGYWFSVAKGEAWYDDLCLIPLGHSPVRPTTSTPTASNAPLAVVTNKDWKGWPKNAPAPAIAPFDAAQAKQHQEAWAKHLNVPVEYTNSIGMKFQLIPPGEFLMGSTPEVIRQSIAFAIPPGDTGWMRYAKSEGPQHKVILTRPFYLATYEVTQSHYEKVMRTNPSYFAETGAGRAAVTGIDTSKHPVETVSWNDATEFCANLSKLEKLESLHLRSGETVTSRDGNGYRLPTEAEWEFSCRAGTTTKYWIGDKMEDLALAGWFGATSRGNSDNKTHPVGELKANPFGLYDVHGNLFEWVQDWWDPTYYEQFQNQPALNPVAPTSVDSQHAMRGGYFDWRGPICGAAYRHGQPPTYRNGSVGFRTALSVDAVKAALANPMQAEAPPVETSGKGPRRVEANQDDPLTVSLRGHEYAVLSLAVSPDGKSLASGDLFGSVLVWNVADRKLRFELPGTAGQNITGLAFSPDGQRIATGNGKSVKVWDATNGQELKTLNGHTDQIWSVAFSSDSKRLASGSHDKSVKVWDVAKGEEVATLTGKAQSFFSVAFSPDGKWLAGSTSSGESAVMLWDTHNWKESQRLTPIDNYVGSIAFSPDSQRLVTASDDGFVKVWDTQTGEDLLTLRDRRQPKSQKPEESHAHHHVQMKSVAMSPDGKRVVSAGSNGFVTVWDAVTGQKLHSLEGHTGEVRGVAFSPDGKWVASAGNDKTVKVWTLTGRTPLPADGTILTTLVDPKKVEAGLKALEGTWQITDHVTSSKQPESPERSAAIKEQRWIFRGDVLTVIVNGEPDESVITVDPTQPLKSIDLGSLSQGDGSPTLLGLYSITGETLKLALSPIEAGRPKAMQIGEGVLGILTLTRTKPFDMKLVDSFNLPAWRQGSKKLQRLKVKTRLLWRGSLRVGQLDRDFGLPKAISRWGVIELPTSTSMSPSTTASDGSIPADIWSEIAAISHVAIVTPAVTDSLLKQLSQHTGLIAIHCRGAWLATASSTAELKKCPNLVSISLEGSSETTAILHMLAALSKLRDLSINNATASKELLTAIAQFKELESLSLINSGVADEHAPLLAKLTKLKMLVLQQTPAAGNDKPKLTNKGLQSLKSLKELKYLDLQGHGLSPEAEANLKASLPECMILR